MTNQYLTPLPAGVNWQDVYAAAIAAGTIPPADLASSFTDGVTVSLVVAYVTQALTPAQLAALQTLANSNPQPATPARIAATAQANLAGASKALRNLATTAAGTTANAGNVVPVVNGILADLVPLLTHAADILDAIGLGQ